MIKGKPFSSKVHPSKRERGKKVNKLSDLQRWSFTELDDAKKPNKQAVSIRASDLNNLNSFRNLKHSDKKKVIEEAKEEDDYEEYIAWKKQNKGDGN